jgi:hypothetical protein
MALLWKVINTAGTSYAVFDDDTGFQWVQGGTTRLSVDDGGVTLTGSATQVTSAAGQTYIVDASAAATGESDVILKDNVADAWTFREAATPYLTFVTTNSGEKISVYKSLALQNVAIVPAAGGTAVLDLSSCATGEGDVVMADNLASAFELREAATVYFRVATTNSGERIEIHKPLYVPAGGSSFLDVSAAATGEADIVIGDNLAAALEVREGANPYLTFVTTNSGEGIRLHKPILVPAGGASIIDASAAATGESDVILGDNLASAFEFREGSTAYLRFKTTDSGEGVEFHKTLSLQGTYIKPAAGGSAFIDLTDVATGEADVILKDNLAIAMEVREGANVYQTLVTTDLAERVTFGKPVQGAAPLSIDMADAAHAIVFGSSAGAGQTLLTSNVVWADANSSGTKDLTLPAPSAALAGVRLLIQNVGGESIVLKKQDTTTIGTLTTGTSIEVVFSAAAVHPITPP